jgi:hypothetical protein|tara:strand:+ start:284 stop:499 length:216 start_codon:yes stop_codon:yes gene_type:complete
MGDIVAELARVTVEEVYNEDQYEALEALLEEEYREAELEAANYGQDDRVLGIVSEPDTTDDGTPIPEWCLF